MNYSLTLSGGGVRGVAHVGMLKILEQQYQFDYYAGASAGSIVAAAHACGYSAKEISEIIYKQKFRKLIFDFSKTNFGLVRGKKVLTLLEEVFMGKTFEDLQQKGITLRVYATDFQTGDRVCLCSGSIAKAVMASISFPIFFDPLAYQGRFLVDGGISGNFPMEETFAEYSGKCIGVDVGTPMRSDIDFSAKNFFGKLNGLQVAMEQTFRIFFKTQQRFPKDHPQIERIFIPDLSDFRAVDFSRMKEIEKVGEAEALKFLS